MCAKGALGCLSSTGIGTEQKIIELLCQQPFVFKCSKVQTVKNSDCATPNVKFDFLLILQETTLCV